MANKVVIDIEARFQDNVTSEAKGAGKAIGELEKKAEQARPDLEKLGKTKVKPLIDIEDSKFMKKLRATEAKMRKLGHTKTAMVLHATDKATRIIDKILKKGQQLHGKVWKPYLKVYAESALNGLQKVSTMGKNLAGKTWRTTVSIIDRATAPLRKLKDMLFSIKTLVMAITAGMAANQFVMKPIQLADAYSGAYIGFSTLLGESRGQGMMNQIDEFAKATPFKTSGVIDNVQKMMAYGWDAEKVIEDMKVIGDAAAATGKGDEGLTSIVYALSEIRSKGKLSTQELNQLASAGIKAKQYLAEGLGYGTSDEGLMKLAKDLEKGVIGANQAVELILQGMKEFNGMMDRTAKETVSGLMGTIEDTFEINIFRRWGQGLQDGARRGLGSVVDLLDSADTALTKFGDTVYEVGKNISNWVADKFENAIKRIVEITDSYEFDKASLAEKISMLWKGVIVNPLKEWWDGGGQKETAETAEKMGRWFGETLTSTLLAILGMTDVLTKSGINKDEGRSVAQSFAQGFVDGFDVSGITDKLAEAISNVWGALPWWAKTLLVGYGASKLGGLVSGIGSLIGAGKGVLGYGANTAIKLGAGNLTGFASLGTGALSALGLGATAGGIMAGAGLIHAGASAHDAYQAYKQGDSQGMKANLARSGFTLAGIGGGAISGGYIGASIGAVGGPVGALIGAGIGTAIGWFAGDKIARNIEAAKYESEEMQEAIKDSEKSAEELAKEFEKAKWKNLKDHFGDIRLSMSEIERLAKQVVWGDDLSSFEKFSSATKNAEANLQSMKNAYEQADKWMWKAGLGVSFNKDEKKSFKAAFDDYVSSAKSFLENKHYEFTASVSMLVDVESEAGKSIIESGDAYYGKLKGELDKAGTELGDALSKALEDGIINADENKAIAAAQQKIASITEKIANAKQQAEIELIKVKFGSGKMDSDSFESFMSMMQTTIDERMKANDEAFTASVASLNLQLKDGAISQEEYDKQLQTLIDGYNSSNAKLKAEIKDVELEIIGDAYSKELGKNAKEKLEKALNEALETGIDPIEWSDEKLCKLLGVDSLSAETASNIKDMLSNVVSQLGLIPVEVNGELYFKLEDGEGKVKEKVDKEVPDKVEKKVDVDITAEKRIQNQIEILAEEFGIPKAKIAPILWQLSASKTIQNKIEILAEEFGINGFEAKTIIWKLFGQKNIMNTLLFSATDFGIQNSYTFNPTINVTPKMGSVTPIRLSTNGLATQEFRGGIVGGSSSMEAFANGGMVRGGARLVKVAEEGTPEMIIPLGSQRRERGIKLWEKAGEMLGVDRFFRGGRTDGGDEGIRFKRHGSATSAGNVQVDVGGVSVTIQVDAKDNTSVAETIKEKVHDIAEEVAGIIADSLEGRFANTPLRG